MTAVKYPWPLPTITPLNEPFWAAARQGQLAIQTCNDCGDAHHPPAHACPNCLSTNQSWKQASGRASLLTWVEFHRNYWRGPEAETHLPYSVCIVKLEEGPMLVSNIVGDASAARLGADMQVVFEKITPEITIPKFAFAS